MAVHSDNSTKTQNTPFTQRCVFGNLAQKDPQGGISEGTWLDCGVGTVRPTVVAARGGGWPATPSPCIRIKLLLRQHSIKRSPQHLHHASNKQNTEELDEEVHVALSPWRAPTCERGRCSSGLGPLMPPPGVFLSLDSKQSTDTPGPGGTMDKKLHHGKCPY